MWRVDNRRNDTERRCPNTLAARFMYVLQELEKMQHLQVLEMVPRNSQFYSAEINECIASNGQQCAALDGLQSANGALATNKYMHPMKEAEGKLGNSKYSASGGAWDNMSLNSSEGKAHTQHQTREQLPRTHEVELLTARMQILEHETEVLKREVIEIVEERKRLLNDICKEFETIGNTLQAEGGEEREEAGDDVSSRENLPSPS